jgi:tetratricopeptide (TPR) repeat protein
VTSSSARTLRLLGSVDLASPLGAPPSLFARPKLLALLGYLCAHADEPPRERTELIALLWPSSPIGHARNSLRQALHVLRNAIGADAIVSSGTTISFSPLALSCDVVELDRALRSRDDLASVRAYRGDFLHGLVVPNTQPVTEWIDRARTGRRRDVMWAAHRLAVAAERDGDAAMTLRWARRAAELMQPWERRESPLAELIARAEAAAPEASGMDARAHTVLHPPARSPIPAHDRIAVTPLLVLSDSDDCRAVAVGFGAALGRALTRWAEQHPPVAASTTRGTDASRTEVPPAAGVVGTIESVGAGYRLCLQLVSELQSILWSDVRVIRAGDIEGHSSLVVASMYERSTEPSSNGALLPTREAGPDEARLAARRGDHFLWQQTPHGLARAMEWYQKATTLDPEQARGWAGMGQVLTMLAVFGASEAADVMPVAVHALDRAVALEPGSATSTALRAMAALVWEWDVARGSALIDAAHALDPSDRESWAIDALYRHAPRGRAAQTIAAAEQLARVAPVDASALSYASLATGFFDFELARRYAEASLHLEPGLPGAQWAMASAALRIGEFALALEHADQLVEGSGGDAGFRAFRAMLHARSGNRATAEETLHELLRMRAPSPTARYNTALLRATLGDTEGAVWAIAAEVERRNPLAIYIGVDPALAAFRDHPTITQLRGRMGL